MKNYLEKLGYTNSKSVAERHALLIRVKKKYGFEYLLRLINIVIKKTPKNRIDDRRILRADLNWIKKEFSKTKNS